jgi:carbon monoxide dehydrogenase subunit G
MKISGAATVHAPVGRVWSALTDPVLLLATIPGCERLEHASSGSYRFAARTKVASIEDGYTGEVSVSRRQEPRSFVLTVSGAGAAGAVSASVQVRLAEVAGGSTELSYHADAVIGGLIAGVGQRMVCSVARRIADEFVSSVDDILASSGRAGTGVASRPTPAIEAHAEPEAAHVRSTQVPAVAPVAATACLQTQLPDLPRPAALVPVPDTEAPAAFARGVLVGAAGVLAGVALAGLIGRRAD